jgi:hypothetical protein
VTIPDRIESFKAAYPKWPAAHPRLVQEQDEDVIYATWVMGNDYRTRSPLYGAYPHGYLPRVQALFPDLMYGATVLHAFSGSVPPGPYLRCDLRGDVELRRSVLQLPDVLGPVFDLVLADPPYSAEDATHYGTPMIDRRLAMEALAKVTVSGGYLVWLDTCWPQHRKVLWRTAGRILVQRSTNHRVRVATIFERRDTDAEA